jgi:hypothetical protein
MSRFYFHIRGPNHFGEDENGEVFTNKKSAIAHAERIAHELRDDPDYYYCSVIVVDERGTEIVQVPIATRH